MRGNSLISAALRFGAALSPTVGSSFAVSGSSTVTFSGGASFNAAGASTGLFSLGIGAFSVQGSSVFFATRSVGDVQIAGTTSLVFYQNNWAFSSNGSSAVTPATGWQFASTGATTIYAENRSPAYMKWVSNNKTQAEFQSTFSGMAKFVIVGRSKARYQYTSGVSRFWVRPYPTIHFRTDLRALRCEGHSRVLFRS